MGHVTPEARKAALETLMDAFDRLPAPVRAVLRDEPIGVSVKEAYLAVAHCRKAGVSEEQMADLIRREIERQSRIRAVVPQA